MTRRRPSGLAGQAGVGNGVGGSPNVKDAFPTRFLSLGLLFLAACLPAMPASRPADFAVVYEWQAGSLPPPYHYEYTLSVGPAENGTIIYQPDYAFSEPPVWTEAFTVTAAALDAVYALARANDVLRDGWGAVDDPPVGGELETAAFTADGRTYTWPYALTEADQARVQPVYAAIRALVPPAVWEKLEAQRQAYMDAQP